MVAAAVGAALVAAGLAYSFPAAASLGCLCVVRRWFSVNGINI
jgi:hypothetical protein